MKRVPGHQSCTLGKVFCQLLKVAHVLLWTWLHWWTTCSLEVCAKKKRKSSWQCIAIYTASIHDNVLHCIMISAWSGEKVKAHTNKVLTSVKMKTFTDNTILIPAPSVLCTFARAAAASLKLSRFCLLACEERKSMQATGAGGIWIKNKH